VFKNVNAIVKAYEQTRFYRDLKLRCTIVQDKKLSLLPKETLFSSYNGVWNLSAEQGSLGSFVITNVRLVWFAQLTENFNASIPWVQVKCIKVQNSKYGVALVIETSSYSGGYVLGFRTDKLDQIYKELASLFKVYSEQPFFAVECNEMESVPASFVASKVEERIDVIETDYDQAIKARLRYEVGKTVKKADGPPEI
jgi:Bardet-Biedl syndrome 5 protein